MSKWGRQLCDVTGYVSRWCTGLCIDCFDQKVCVSKWTGCIPGIGHPYATCFLCAMYYAGPGVAQMPLRLIVASILARLIVLPLAGTALVGLPYIAGWFPGLHPMAIIGMLYVRGSCESWESYMLWQL